MNRNRPMSHLRKAKEKAKKDAALSAEVEQIMKDAAANVRHLIAKEKKRVSVDPHFFIGAMSTPSAEAAGEG